MSENTIFERKNVIVTGGAGFIGSFLCERLIKDSNVICIDNFSTSAVANIEHLFKEPNFELIRHDINQPLDLEVFPELKHFKIPFQGIQEIYHLACPTSAKRFDQFKMETLKSNSIGINNILDMARKYNAKFFLASSSVVYGPRNDNHPHVSEEEFGIMNHLTPRGCYDEGKRWSETAAFTYADVYKLDVRIGRIFRTYGPRMPLRDGQVVPDFVIDALEEKPVTIYGDQNFKTSLLYVSDAVDAIVKTMTTSKNHGPLNIGSDVDVLLVGVVEKILEMTKSKSSIIFEQPMLFMSQLPLPNITKIKEAISWFPLVSLEQGLAKTIEYTIARRGLVQTDL